MAPGFVRSYTSGSPFEVSTDAPAGGLRSFFPLEPRKCSFSFTLRLLRAKTLFPIVRSLESSLSGAYLFFPFAGSFPELGLRLCSVQGTMLPPPLLQLESFSLSPLWTKLEAPPLVELVDSSFFCDDTKKSTTPWLPLRSYGYEVTAQFTEFPFWVDKAAMPVRCLGWIRSIDLVHPCLTVPLL